MKASPHAGLLATLQQRFGQHPERHPGLAWTTVEARLAAHPKKLAVLAAMEASGGEPDMIAQDPATGALSFCDCAAESPAGRRSLCYDDAALAARKLHKPAGSAVALAASLGIELLDEAQYRHLQTLGAFDTKPPAGCARRRPSASWAARCSATGATARSSPTTTAPSRTTPRGAFAGC